MKSTGVVQAALPAATSPVPNTELADITYDNFQGIDEPTLPFTATSRGTRNDRAVGCHDQQPSGQSASSEEEGEAEDNSCEMTRKRSRRLADSLMRFSIDFLRAVQLESNRTNMVLSPLSIALALAQLALGNFLVTKAPFPAPPTPYPLLEAARTRMQIANTKYGNIPDIPHFILLLPFELDRITTAAALHSPAEAPTLLPLL